MYGLILVAGMIVVGSYVSSDSWEALLIVLATVLVFFAAHVYAGTIAALAHDGSRTFGAALRAAFLHSLGMVTVAVVPLVVLALGVSRLMPDEYALWGALLADVMLLALVGWLMAAARTTDVWLRLGGAVVTAAFGGVIIALKVAIHV